ncbi:hypothetical protein BDV98DRAFT_567603 [Pterulicium gracile]|uniref:Secreted protein n=1 Tax=Pterulicium gracile TaxID=1884261 RepID=A0A5C3QKE6_9AGAR|nr:hypothetical protein BDV98DRAFT_567603 [Pterula gracilis]
MTIFILIILSTLAFRQSSIFRTFYTFSARPAWGSRIRLGSTIHLSQADTIFPLAFQPSPGFLFSRLLHCLCSFLIYHLGSLYNCWTIGILYLDVLPTRMFIILATRCFLILESEGRLVDGSIHNV